MGLLKKTLTAERQKRANGQQREIVFALASASKCLVWLNSRLAVAGALTTVVNQHQFAARSPIRWPDRRHPRSDRQSDRSSALFETVTVPARSHASLPATMPQSAGRLDARAFCHLLDVLGVLQKPKRAPTQVARHRWSASGNVSCARRARGAAAP